MKRELERIEIPGEHEARLRTWEVVRAAFAEREPSPSNKLLLVRWRLLVVAAAAAAIVAAAVTAPGRALLDEVREAIGVEDAEEALFSLPTDGRLLVVGGHGDVWIVDADGGRRRLGDYPFATWSPRGLYVAAARGNELVALDPVGEERWKLARPDVAWPQWAGPRVDTRIAYKSGRTLRVVAGDGEPDRLLATNVAFDAPALAWRPGGAVHVLAYADARGAVHVVEADSGRKRWRSARGDRVQQLAWSRDGTRLVALGSRAVRIFRGDGKLLRSLPFRGGPSAVAFSPRPNHVFALSRGTRSDFSHSEVVLLRAERETGEPRRVFEGTGIFQDVAWSPDGRWLLVTWPSADQWVFVRVAGGRRIEAVANVTEQFAAPGAVFPVVAGWCCPAR